MLKTSTITGFYVNQELNERIRQVKALKFLAHTVMTGAAISLSNGILEPFRNFPEEVDFDFKNNSCEDNRSWNSTCNSLLYFG